MEKEKKPKKYIRKMKIRKDESFEIEQKLKKPTKIKNISSSCGGDNLKQVFSELYFHNFDYIPVNVFEVKNFDEKEDSKKSEEDNYTQKISEKKEKINKANNDVNTLLSKKYQILEFLKEINENIKYENNNIISKIKNIKDEEFIIENLENEIKMLKDTVEKSTVQKNAQKKLSEGSSKTKSNEILLFCQDINKEKNSLSNMITKKDEDKISIIKEEENIKLKYEAINNEQAQKAGFIQKKNKLKEEYEKVNKIAINDNKFCHDNFYSLLTFFPYYKNVAFISSNNEEQKGQKLNISFTGDDKITDINRIITEEEINEGIDKENIQNIQLLINQRENCDKNVNFKILKDRRTLQITPKEKYKFKKIFSIINNNYIAELWDDIKYTSLKLSTINSYFNEFNMTAISNNYFIIYFLPKIEQTSINNEVFKLFENLKNNEYIDKNINVKISAITESNYINLQNINQESKIKNQLLSLNNSGQTIYGFLYEIIKTNRLNKKNIFRIYNFDYCYPYAVEMMNNINKYYAKKKRKKTGIYKKVIRQGQGKKKKQGDRSTSNNNINKGKPKPNLNKKNNNVKKGQIKKTVNFVNNVNSKNVKRNNSYIISGQNNKLKNINKNKNNVNKKQNIQSKDNKNNATKKLNTTVDNIKNNNISIDQKLNTNQKEEDKKILKKSGSQNQSSKKKISKINLIINNNNIKVVKFGIKSYSKTPKKNNSENKNGVNKQKSIYLVFNDLKQIKPEHTLVIHDINYEFVNTNEFKQVAKACGILNNIQK